MVCPICGNGDVIRKAQPRPYAFYRCGSCGVYFVWPLPTEDRAQADAHYTETYYAGGARPDEDLFEAVSREGVEARVRDLSARLGGPGRLLDVGCGTGMLVEAAAAAGWDARGVEVSARAAEHARRARGVNVATGTLSDAAFPAHAFDAVTLIHVIEHVPDPAGVLTEIRRVLRPGGILRVAAPNASGLLYAACNVMHRATGRYGKDKFSCSLCPPSHLFAWDSDAMRGLLTRAGFVVEEVVITGKGDPAFYPVARWSEMGRAWPALRALEWLGRRTGRGTLLELVARTP